MKECDAEIILWQWLKENKNINDVYFNRKNEVNAKIFKVKGETKEIPDLVISCILFGKEEYIAIEVKNGEESINVIQSNKILNIYYKNYIEGRTEYFINDKKILISKFIVATQYSKFGNLIRDGDIIETNGSGFENDSWINKNVPLLEYSKTKLFGRMLIHNFSEFRKKNNIKSGCGIGWLVSDIILTFSEEELKIQSGMIGNPIIQGIFFNNKLNRWSQNIIKI